MANGDGSYDKPSGCKECLWPRERVIILSDMDRMKETIRRLEDKVYELEKRANHETTDLKVAVGKLQVSASVYGAFAGILAAVAAILLRGIGTVP